jgi:hypothetical protein
MTTATIGKSGAAFVQDYKRGGMMLDERTVLPLSLAQELQSAGIPLPATSPNAYGPGMLTLAQDNGSPTGFAAPKRLKDGVTFDASDTSGSPYKRALQYMFDTYVNYVLPKKQPKLSVLWIRDPDTSQHTYGVGSANAIDGLHSNDRMLGQLRAKLQELRMDQSSDIIVVSDHAHSNVSGSQSFFPLRAIRDGDLGEIDPSGYSVSGLVRLADLLHRAGFSVFDGTGCSYLPVSFGIKADGTPVYATLIDMDGKICGKEGQKYNISAFKVPEKLPPKSIVIAVNGGSDYLYVPDRDSETVHKAVAFLQTLGAIGSVFVDSRYGDVPGTMPMNLVKIENVAGRNPDIMVSYDYDENATIGGVKGTEYSGSLLNNPYRGMHGSFSPIDVHNTLIAIGPDFREGLVDELPTGNVDVAPTVASILGLNLQHADGRPLLEALRNGPSARDFQVVSGAFRPKHPVTGIAVKRPTDPAGNDIEPGQTMYSFQLDTKALSYKGKTYMYFDKAKVIRQ